MKKLLSITGMLLLGSAGHSYGQWLGITNYLTGPGTGASVSVTAHDGGTYTACGSLVGWTFPLNPISSGINYQVIFNDVTENNSTTTCTPPGTGFVPPWMAGACAHASTSAEWDDATITIAGTAFGVVNPLSSCASGSSIVTLPTSVGMVTVEWRIDGPTSTATKIDIYF